MNALTTRAENKSARRRLIVETAFACFVEKGFHQTSMRDVAKRAGISLGNLYNHFESKTAMIAEIAALEAQELESLEQQIAKIDDPEKALARFVRLYTTYCCWDGNTAFSVEIIAECLRNPKLGKGFLKNRSKLNATIAALIERITKTRNSRPKINPGDSAEFIFDLIEGLALRCAFDQRKPTRRDISMLNSAVQKIIDS